MSIQLVECQPIHSELTGDASRPAAVDEWLPEGPIRLADDLGCGRGVVVVLKELALWAVVLQN